MDGEPLHSSIHTLAILQTNVPDLTEPSNWPSNSSDLKLVECLITPPPIGIGGRGIVFARFLCLFLCLFVSLFLCQQDYEKTAGPICVKFSGKVCSEHGTT